MLKDKFDLLLEIIQKKYRPRLQVVKNNCFSYSGTVKIDDLAKIFQVPTSEIIIFFLQQGKEINKYQDLPSELISAYCQSRGLKVQEEKGVTFNEIIAEYLKQIDKNQDLLPRSPIVSIMGHIDHGKTTLLDTIQQTQKQKKEAGGITQKLSVSQIDFQGKKITFCDTPGHSVFMQMRQRGVALTDLVILVISAEDGLMSQTVEVIQYIHQYNLPVIVFLNHKKPLETDNEINLQKIKGQLQERNLISVDWGGETIIISGNAKEKKSAETLLENILLLSELKEWKSNFQRSADGIVIDSYLNPKQGIVTNLLIRGGKLQVNDWIFVNGREGKIKRMLNSQREIINQALPSETVWVIGLDFLAEAGETFLVINEEDVRKEINGLVANQVENKSLNFIPIASTNFDQKIINLIIFADSQSSLEALENIIKQKSTNFQILYKSASNLNDFALNLAKINASYIILFNVKLNKNFIQTLKENNIHWFSSQIIYQIEEQLEKIIQNKQQKQQVEKIMGTAKVKKVFYFSKTGNIAGCQVINGIINRNHLVNIVRQGKKLATAGKIRSLESNKNNLLEVREGQECGIVLNNFDDFLENDQIVAYQIIEENVT